MTQARFPWLSFGFFLPPSSKICSHESRGHQQQLDHVEKSFLFSMHPRHLGLQMARGDERCSASMSACQHVSLPANGAAARVLAMRASGCDLPMLLATTPCTQLGASEDCEFRAQPAGQLLCASDFEHTK